MRRGDVTSPGFSRPMRERPLGNGGSAGERWIRNRPSSIHSKVVVLRSVVPGSSGLSTSHIQVPARMSRAATDGSGVGDATYASHVASLHAACHSGPDSERHAFVNPAL